MPEPATCGRNQTRLQVRPLYASVVSPFLPESGEFEWLLKTVELARTIGLKTLVILSLSSMLGSGSFSFPAFAHEYAGPGMWFAFLLAGSVVIASAYSKAELASAMPQSGGFYVYAERTYGHLCRHHQRARFVCLFYAEISVRLGGLCRLHESHHRPLWHRKRQLERHRHGASGVHFVRELDRSQSHQESSDSYC